jgi:tetratricopeptide (TPR) repeat protein
MPVLGVVRVDERSHTALLKVDPTGRTATPMDISDQEPAAGQAWQFSIASVEGVGILSAPFTVLRVREWPIEGPLAWVRMPSNSISGGGVALDDQHRLRGLRIGSGGGETSLFAMIRPEMATKLIKARRLERRGLDGDGDRIADLRGALKLEPSMWRAQWYLGVLLDEAGQPDAALAEFDKSVKLTPWYSEPLFSTGLIHLKQKRFDEAVAWFDKAIEADDRYPAPRGMKAVALFSAGKHEEAVAAGREAIRVGPREWRHHQNLVVFLKRMGRGEDAIEVLRTYCRNNPKEPPGWDALSIHLRDAGDSEGAEKALRDGLEHQESVVLYRSLVPILARREDKEGTLAVLRKVLELAPDAADAPKYRKIMEAIESDFAPEKK